MSGIKVTKNHMIKSNFNNLLSHSVQAKTLIYNMSMYGHLILFGGAVRDLLQNKKFPRDIDIVVATEQIELDRCFEGFNTRKNHFGGYKLCIDGLVFDIWSLPVTWAFREKHLPGNHFRDLTESVFLNYDSILYDLTDETLYNGYFQDVEKHKVLDIVLEDNPFPALNIMRAFVFQKEHQFSFSNRLTKYIYQWKTEHADRAIQILREWQFKHYGTEKMDDHELRERLTSIDIGVQEETAIY
jgi:hypothetical protein